MYCQCCGVFWLNPRPIAADIPKCYPEGYFTHEVVEPLTLGRSEKARRLRSAVLSHQFGYQQLDDARKWLALVGKVMMLIPPLQQRLTMGLEALLVPYRPNGRLLDIGCGNGAYLALMKQLGWTVAGIETDAKAAAVAQSHFGISVFVGTVDDAPFEEASFDVVTMSHVLEHVPDPVRFLQVAARFLKPGGRMVIITPNAQSLGSRLFRKDWYALQPPQHLILFTLRGLRKCIDQTGLFEHLQMHTSARQSRKFMKKFVLVRKIGSFRHKDIEVALSQHWQTRLFTWLFQFVERLGNPLWQWGEEIECIAVKG